MRSPMGYGNDSGQSGPFGDFACRDASLAQSIAKSEMLIKR